VPALRVQLAILQRGVDQPGGDLLRGALLLLGQRLQRALQVEVQRESARRGGRRQAEEGAQVVKEIHTTIL